MHIPLGKIVYSVFAVVAFLPSFILGGEQVDCSIVSIFFYPSQQCASITGADYYCYNEYTCCASQNGCCYNG